MRDLLPTLAEWRAAGRAAAVGRVVGIDGSAPRELGATMAVAGDGEVLGSVSGGCVEAAVVEEAQAVLAGGEPRVVTFGISDDDAMAVGLTCGGRIDVLLAGLDATVGPLADAVADGEPVALATVVEGPATGLTLLVGEGWQVGGLGEDRLDAAVAREARGRLASGGVARRRYGPSGERDGDAVAVLLEAYVPPPRMYVLGAVDYAAAVARAGKLLGFTVVVCDARAVFATPARFPEADEVVVDWPHRHLADAPIDERTAVCVLTHDPKFDVPVLEVALRSPAGYVGAMGSRRTHDDRMARLRAAGLDDDELARLRSPVGLDLGGRTPEETAVAIAAEIVAVRWGGSGLPLRETSGAIHPRAAERA